MKYAFLRIEQAANARLRARNRDFAAYSRFRVTTASDRLVKLGFRDERVM